MTPEAAHLMRHNLQLVADQQDALALRARNEDDADTCRRGAATYRRLITTLPEREKGEPVSPIYPPTT